MSHAIIPALVAIACATTIASSVAATPAASTAASEPRPAPPMSDGRAPLRMRDVAGKDTDAAPLTAAASATLVKLRNPGFEDNVTAGDPPGWITGQHAGVDSYVFTVDDQERHGGRRSLRIDNIGPEPFGAIYQSVPITGLAGKTVRLRGWVKARDAGGRRAGGGAALQLQAKKGGSPLAYNTLADHIFRGTHDWNRREVVLAIPSDTELIEIGILLRGGGSVWLDDVELAVLAAP